LLLETRRQRRIPLRLRCSVSSAIRSSANWNKVGVRWLFLLLEPLPHVRIVDWGSPLRVTPELRRDRRRSTGHTSHSTLHAHDSTLHTCDSLTWGSGSRCWRRSTLATTTIDGAAHARLHAVNARCERDAIDGHLSRAISELNTGNVRRCLGVDRCCRSVDRIGVSAHPHVRKVVALDYAKGSAVNVVEARSMRAADPSRTASRRVAVNVVVVTIDSRESVSSHSMCGHRLRRDGD